MNKESLLHTYTRLQTKNSAVFLAESETGDNPLVVKKHLIILDNEIENEELRLDIKPSSFKLFKEFFESLHGKEMSYINTNDFDMNDNAFDVILDNGLGMLCLELTNGNKPMYFATLMERGSSAGQECTIEISKEVYDEFKKYSLGAR